MADAVTISSKLHGDRVWHRLGRRTYTTKDGRRVALVTWASTCTICGATFTVETRRRAESGRDPAFAAVTCLRHRLNAAERGSLFAGDDNRRRRAFAAIKKEKLEQDAAPSGQPPGAHDAVSS
jgi:hypothetical protein